jgi:hypothetical protein
VTWYEVTATKNDDEVPIFYLDERSLNLIPDTFYAKTVAENIIRDKSTDRIKVRIRVVR